MYSKEIIKEFTLTINLILYTLMPTMFFQILLSNLLISSDLYKYIPQKICDYLNISKYELSIILISLFSGYPNNIRLLKESENEYLNYVSNYINPTFLLITVGSIYLHNIRITILIYLSHILSNIIMLLIFKYRYRSSKYNHLITNNIYSNSLNNTINTLKIVFSNLLFMSILTTLISLIIKDNFIKSIILGILEFSRGIYEISFLNISIYLKGFLILIIITFGSISIHFQSICLNNKIKYIKFLVFRILNVLISIIIYFLLLFISELIP